MNATEAQLERLRALEIGGATSQPPAVGTFFNYDDHEALRVALAPLAGSRVNILPHAKIKAARAVGQQTPLGEVCGLDSALARVHDSDAHTQAALVPSLIVEHRSPRFPRELIKLGAELGALIFDLDLPDHGSARMTPELFRRLVSELSASEMLRGAVFYATRGGLRALRPLENTYRVTTDLGEDWRAFYERVVDKLPAPSLGSWDAGCSDVPRLMRLPWVRRDGEIQRGGFWVPDTIEAYALTGEDHATVLNASLPRRSATHGISGDRLPMFFDAIGLMRREHTEINGHPSYCVRCPFESRHSSDNETSTVLLATEGGAEYVLHCLHDSCRPLREGGAWRRHLQTKYEEAWEEYVGADATQYVYSPDDHLGFVQAATTVLEYAFPERIFRRHDQISTVERDPFGGARWRVWSVADLTGLLNRRGNWVSERVTRDGSLESRPTSIPERMVKIHALAIAEELPECHHSTTLPPLDPTTLEPTRFSEGYCPVTQSYFLPPPHLDLEELRRVCSISADRSAALVAYSALVELFCDFPWRTPAHRALAVGVIMTAALRRSMDIAPLLFVEANDKGVGKTKLVRAALASVYGVDPKLSSLPPREEELKKTLDALAEADADLYVADNVASKIGGAVLDGFITSPIVSYRVLGSTQMRTAQNRVFLAATGNNATVGGDTDRRMILTRLVSTHEDPSQRRGFRYIDLIEEAKRRTTATWAHLLTILRAWRDCATEIERQEIREGARALGSFERWVELVRDPIMWVASLVEGVSVDLVALSAQEMQLAQDDGKGEFLELVATYQEIKGWGVEWRLAEFATALNDAIDNDHHDLAEYTQHYPPPRSGRYTAKSLSHTFRRRTEQVSGGYQLIARSRKKTAYYELQRTSAPTPPHVPPSPAGDPFRAPPARPDALPVINLYEWRSCEQSAPHDVDPRLIEKSEDYATLSRRCAFLRGDLCAKERIPCEYEGSDAGMTQALADALRARHDDRVREYEAPSLPQIVTTGDDPRALKIIAAEFAVKTKLADISARLNSEQIPPPNGRKWTATKVSHLAKRNQITKPKKEVKSKAAAILERDGHWVDYWPTTHPLTTPNTGARARRLDGGGRRAVSSRDILTRLYGRLMTVRSAFMERVRREEEGE